MIINMKIVFIIGPKDIDYFSFVSEGWKKEQNNKSLCEQVVEAKKIELTPQTVRFKKKIFVT